MSNDRDDNRRAIAEAVDESRLLETAIRLIEIPSFTRDAGAALDALAAILNDEGFAVERVDAGWPSAPAVAARLTSGAAGRTLQFNGHLDTVHLPFTPPAVDDGVLTGSGCSDMKGGVAARRRGDAGASRHRSAHRRRRAPDGS